MKNKYDNDGNCIVLHIPHSVRKVDEKYKNLFYRYDDEKFNEEMEWLANKMVDSYTDELFDIDGLDKIVFGTSRLLCDVERYRDDKNEIMAKRGMGVCYTKDCNLNNLKECPKKYKEEMYKLYDMHHVKFEEIVSQKLKAFGKCIIIDCHSFASQKFEYELCKEKSRPDFCIGVNGNEGEDVANRIIRRLKELKKKVYENGLWIEKEYDIRINSPFSGSIKPLKYVNEKSVVSVMVEVNRYLYMDEVTGNKSGNFDNIKGILRDAIINVDGRNDKRIKNGMKYLSTHYVSVMAGASMSTYLWKIGATKADFEKMMKRSPNFNKNLNY